MENIVPGSASPQVTFQVVTSSDVPPAPKRMFSAPAAAVKPVPEVGCLSHLSHGCPGFTDRTAVMKVTPQTLGTVLGNLQIVIPLFQRRYCWTEKQGASWWRDLRNLMKKGGWNSSHGTGKIVVMQQKSGGVSQMVCIDGQQRLTTTMLLIAAIRDAAAAIAPNDSAAFAALQSRLNSLLYMADANCRLQPSYIDRASFFSLLGYGDHVSPSTPTSVNPSLVSMKSLFDQRVAEMLRGCASRDKMVAALAQVLVQAVDEMYVVCTEVETPGANLCQIFLWLQLTSCTCFLYNASPGETFYAADLVRNFLLAPQMMSKGGDVSSRALEEAFVRRWVGPVELRLPSTSAIDATLNAFMAHWYGYEFHGKWKNQRASVGEFEKTIVGTISFLKSKKVIAHSTDGVELYACFLTFFDDFQKCQGLNENAALNSILEMFVEFIARCYC